MPITWLFSRHGMTWFQLGNVVATLLALSILVYLFIRRPQDFVRPSMQVLAFYHLLIQWPVVYLSRFIETWVHDEWHVFILVHGFVLIGIPLALSSSRQTVIEIWTRLRGDGAGASDNAWAVNALFVTAIACAAVYLTAVDITDTGLYVLLTDPVHASEARVESLKALPSMLPKYALSVLSSTIAPLFTAFAVVAWLHRTPASRWNSLYPTMLLPVVWILALLSGAKGIAVFLVMVVVATYLWDRRLRLPLAAAVLAIPIMLVPAVAYVVVIANAHYEVGAMALMDRLAEAILKRAFLVPATTGIWHIDYAQSEGLVGIAGQLRLASALGEEAMRLPMVIGQYYGPAYYGDEVATHFSANTGFLFTAYACFGLLGLPLALAMLLCCDLPLILLRLLPRSWMVPAMGATSVAVLKFVQSDYTTVWLTHGFGLIALLAWGLWAMRELRRAMSSERPGMSAGDQRGAGGVLSV
ncbi:MAG: hypothetical protein HONDAALG_00899 [Gammaproteobacteria bacterium]|nr:hypothetical protein [Gammaproteobacteria bacterium]